jgi:hypothetical protein
MIPCRFLLRFVSYSLKKLRFIFIFVFLSGMLFTVFQYVPILEEETPGHRVELTKKAKAGDLEGGDSDTSTDDCDNDDDTAQEFNYYLSETLSYIKSNSNFAFSDKSDFYKYLLEHIDTPPPKV